MAKWRLATGDSCDWRQKPRQVEFLKEEKTCDLIKNLYVNLKYRIKMRKLKPEGIAM